MTVGCVYRWVGGCPRGMGAGCVGEAGGYIHLCVRVLIQLPWQRGVLWTDVKRRLVGVEAAVISMVCVCACACMCVWGGWVGGGGGGRSFHINFIPLSQHFCEHHSPRAVSLTLTATSRQLFQKLRSHRNRQCQ